MEKVIEWYGETCLYTIFCCIIRGKKIIMKEDRLNAKNPQMESYFDGYLPVAAGVRAAVRYEKETFSCQIHLTRKNL